jgi:hypothetical protein
MRFGPARVGAEEAVGNPQTTFCQCSISLVVIATNPNASDPFSGPLEFPENRRRKVGSSLKFCNKSPAVQ